MGNNIYNNRDVKNSEIVKLLNELPKISAPSNFEYNLMVKIKNGEFEIRDEKNRSRRIAWIVTPAFGVALSALLFFWLIPPSNDMENPFMVAPRVRTEIATSSVGTMSLPSAKTDNKTIAKNRVQSANVGGASMQGGIGGYRVVLQPNDVVTKEKVNSPFDNSRSMDIDKYLQGGSSGSNMAGNVQGRLVGEGGDNNNFNFNGFFAPEEDKIIDSLRRMTLRFDSLKNRK